jgi:hypothetical protein
MKLISSPYIKKFLGRVGDIGCPDFDGGFVFIHSQTDAPEIEWVEAPSESWECALCWGSGAVEECCDDLACYECNLRENQALCLACKGSGLNPHLRWRVFRACVEQPSCVDENDIKRIKRIAITMGIAWQTLQDLLTSKEPMALASAMMMVAEYYSWENFDSDPLVLTFSEINERYEGFERFCLP